MPQMLLNDRTNGMFSYALAFDPLTSVQKENHDFKVH